MRYVAKIYVMDVMDQLVVSGYVHAADDFQQEPPDMCEFTWQVPGKGVTEPVAWLRDALARAVPRTAAATLEES
jgi:hypothetical protein